MMIGLKRIAVLLLPPLLTNLLRGLHQRWSAGQDGSAAVDLNDAIRDPAPEWEVVSEEGWTVSDGWQHPSVVDTKVAKWKGYSEAIMRPKPLGMDRETPPGAPINVSSHNVMMTFGYVLGRAIATQSGRPVKVLDWGGGIGTYALLTKQLYPEVAIAYTVNELPLLAEAGQKLLADVEFTSDGAAALRNPYDLIYAGSSLQYVRDVYGLLAKIAGSGSRWIMICRMPFVDEADDFVVVQRPQRHGYDTEYMCWFLNRNKFVRFMRSCGYELDREFLTDERPTVTGAPEQCSYRGFLFERSEGPA